MSPIEGLTNVPRLPRLGKIRLGTRVKNDKGVEYPRAADHFVCPPEVQAVFGEKPKSLRIMFPVDNLNIFAAQFYKWYGQERLYCRGDGLTADRSVDAETGGPADHNSKNVVRRDVPCEGRQCCYYGPGKGKGCTEVMTLQFLLPDVPGLGVWQIDTGSVNSMRNINSTVRMLQAVLGRVSGVPLDLVVDMEEIAGPDGKKKRVPIMHLESDIKLQELASKPRFMITKESVVLPDIKEQGKVISMADPVLPNPEDGGPPTEIMPNEQDPGPDWPADIDSGVAPAGVAPDNTTAASPGPGTALTTAAVAVPLSVMSPTPAPPTDPEDWTVAEFGPPKLTSFGVFWTECYKRFGLMRAEVLRLLGKTDNMEIGDLKEAYKTVLSKVPKPQEGNHGK